MGNSGKHAGNGTTYRTEADPVVLLGHLEAIRTLADSEKESLGFLPEAAIRDAIVAKRLIAMLAIREGRTELAGYVLFSGVFPNARVQQIAVAKPYRRARLGAALINQLVSNLEVQGFLTLSAAVASDLGSAQSFYEQQGFVARTTKMGGAARGRTIVLRARYLENRSLLSILEEPETYSQALDLGLQLRGAGQAPLYGIDLNVLFDAVKGPNRSRAPLAERLVGAALAHQFRLVVATEFLTELERTTKGETVDPILALARKLPRLPPVDSAERDRLANMIHDIVFAKSGSAEAASNQALSDCQHLAHAALARASGYVTSDGKILSARTELRQKIGIDVASLQEFVDLLTDEQTVPDQLHLEGTDCRFSATSLMRIHAFLKSCGVPDKILDGFPPESASATVSQGVSVSEGDRVAGIGVLKSPDTVDAPARILVHVRPDHVACDIFADKIIDTLCREICRKGPVAIEMTCSPGQAVARRAAILRGFLPTTDPNILIKVAVGRPITMSNWDAVVQQTRRRTGLVIPDHDAALKDFKNGICIQRPDGKNVIVRLNALEEALAPTIITWPGRDGVIVPIAKTYADDLLGTDGQFKLFGNPEASCRPTDIFL